MANFIDNTPFGALPPSTSYNKICFTSKEEAEIMLNKKPLAPGQVAFAYYYDQNCYDGINVIAAVGSLNQQGNNILFLSKDSINQLVDQIEIQFDGQDTSIAVIHKELLDKLELFTSNTNAKISDLNSQVVEALRKVENIDEITIRNLVDVSTDIADIKQDIESINSSINGIINDVNEKYDETNDKFSEVEINLGNLKTDLEVEIEDNKSYLKGYINNEVNNVNETLNDVSKNLSTTNTNLFNIAETLSGSIIDEARTITDKLNSEIVNMNVSINKLSDKIDASIKDIIEDELSDYVDDVQEVIDRAKDELDRTKEELIEDNQQQFNEMNQTIADNNSSICNLVNVKNKAMAEFIRGEEQLLREEIKAGDASLQSQITDYDLKLSNLDLKHLDNEQEIIKESRLNDTSILRYIKDENASIKVVLFKSFGFNIKYSTFLF